MKRKVALVLTSVMVLSMVGGCSSSDGGSKGGSGDSGDKVVMNMTTLNGGTNDVFAEAVQKEIDHIKGIKNKEKLLTVKCFGEFEVLCKGNPLKFKRSKTKEVLAIMIDRKGARLSSRTICAVLWPESLDDGKNINYLHQIFIDLKNSLKEVNALAVFNQCGYDYYLNVDKIDCDYYDYLEKGKPDFKGEYMSQYSWAEETCALLWNNK